MKEFKFISKKKKEKIKMFSKDNELSSNTMIELYDNNNFYLEGCLGVEDYKEDYIKLKIKKGFIDIYGKALNILYFEEKNIKVGGTIKSIEYFM